MIDLKTVEFELNGRTLHLLMNANALFACWDKFGDGDDLMERIAGTNSESWDNTVWMLVKLSQQGEAWRRYMGEEPIKVLTAEEAQRTMLPSDALRARAAIRTAYALCFQREQEQEEQEVDLFLEEYQKKTEPVSPAQSGSASQRSFFACLFGKR